MKDQFKIYFSHPIMGKKGDKATDKDIMENIHHAVWAGTQIKSYLLDWEKMDGFPRMDLYVPGEHDEFVQIAYKKKYLTMEQILDVDCAIIDKCKLLITYGTYFSNGMRVEIKHAEKKGIALCHMGDLGEESLMALKLIIQLILIGG